MMSYLEGESLLKEIEKSLEELGEDDVIVDDTDCEIVQIPKINEASSIKNKRILSSNIKSSSFTRPSSSFTNHTTSSHIRKRKRN